MVNVYTSFGVVSQYRHTFFDFELSWSFPFFQCNHKFLLISSLTMICLPRRDDFLWVGRFSSVGVVWWFDLFLLCSDGLWEMVRDPRMADILQMYNGTPTLASHALLRAALQAGGSDNVSLLVARVQP